MKQKLLKSILLAFLFMLIFTFPTFATEETQPTKHTIEIEVPANEEIVMPYIWGDGSYSPIYNSATTASFTVPDNNFAFETNARDINGNACNAQYTVALNKTSSDNNVAALYNTANGTTKKLDWIDTTPGSSYRFKIYNSSSTTLAVYIVYYSWN